MKKISIIILLILIVSLILGLGLLTKFKPGPIHPQPPILNPSNSPISQYPSNTNPVAQQITNPTVNSPAPGLHINFPSLLNNYVYYLSDGFSTFYKVSLDGKDRQAITPELVAKITDVIWSPDKSMAVIRVENNKYFLGKNKSQFFSNNDADLATTNWIYNFKNQSAKQLDSNITSITFSKSGDKLYYVKVNRQIDAPANLYQADLNGQNESLIVTLTKPDQVISVITDQLLLTYLTPEGVGQNFLYLINVADKKLDILDQSSLAFGAKTAPNGQHVLTQLINGNDNTHDLMGLIDVSKRQISKLDFKADLNLTTWDPTGSLVFTINGSNLEILDAHSLQVKTLTLSTDTANLAPDPNSLMVVSLHSIYFTSQGVLYNLTF